MIKQKPIKHIEVGAYEFDFYFKSDSVKNTYMTIKCGEVATIRIDGRTHAYGYLFAAAEQGHNEQLHGYAALLNILAMGLTKDQELVNDVVAAINSYIQRKDAAGAEKAAQVTEAQENGDQALMEGIIAEASMTESERKTAQESFKEEVKNVIEGKEDGI